MEDYKVIASRIRSKIDSWLESIYQPYLREYLRDSVIVAGGAIASFIQDEEPHDYDIYFRTDECLNEVIEYYSESTYIPNYIRNSANERKPFFCKCYEGKEGYEGLDKYSILCYSSSAITLKGGIQLVTCTYGEPDQVSSSFDYLHSQGVYDYRNDEVIITPEIVEAIKKKRLIYTGSDYPIASLIRMRKFIRRGYYINSGQILKIALDINRLNLKDTNILKRQLIGVDVAYFQTLMNKLDEVKSDTLDTDRLVQLIDEFYDDQSNTDDEDQDK